MDTSVWIDYFEGASDEHTTWLDRELTRQRLGLTDLILCEVWQGIREDRVFSQVQRDLSRFRIFVTGGKYLPVRAAQNYRFLRHAGHPVRKTIACLIATFYLDAGHLLLHRDRDFDPFKRELGLSVIHPRLTKHLFSLLEAIL